MSRFNDYDGAKMVLDNLVNFGYLEDVIYESNVIYFKVTKQDYIQIILNGLIKHDFKVSHNGLSFEMGF